MTRDFEGRVALVTGATSGIGAACARAVAETVERLGSLDVLVNNAGISIAASALETSDEQWDATLETNLGAVFCLSRAALRPMLARRRGAIVNVASD